MTEKDESEGKSVEEVKERAEKAGKYMIQMEKEFEEALAEGMEESLAENKDEEE
jgi:hypothetical protein